MRERAALQALYEKYRGRGFVVLAVAMDPQGASLVGPYKKKYALTFPHLLDSRREVSLVYGIRGTPTNYIIDRRGRVVAGAVGYRDLASPDAGRLIEALLDEPREDAETVLPDKLAKPAKGG